MDDKELKEKINGLIDNLDKVLNSNRRNSTQKNAALQTAFDEINKLENDDDVKGYIGKLQEAYAANKKALEKEEKELQKEDKQYGTSHTKDSMLVNYEELDRKIKGVSDRIESVITVSKEYNEEEYKSALDVLLVSAEAAAKKSNEYYAKYNEPYEEIEQATEMYKQDIDEVDATKKLFEQYDKILVELNTAKGKTPVDANKIHELNAKLENAKNDIKSNPKSKSMMNNAIKEGSDYVSLEECLNKNKTLKDFIGGSIYDKNNPMIAKDNLNKQKEKMTNKIYEEYKNNAEIANRYQSLTGGNINTATNDEIDSFLKDSETIRISLQRKAMVANKKLNNIKDTKGRLDLEKTVSVSEYFQKTASDQEKENVKMIVRDSTSKHKNRRAFWKEEGYNGFIAFFKAFNKKNTVARVEAKQYSDYKARKKNNRVNNFKANLQKISRDNNRAVDKNDRMNAYNVSLENDRSDDGR